MHQISTLAPEAPESASGPLVLDGGSVVAVTLGKNGFDVIDGTQYRQKTPGAAAV
ncbi:hypothetical protein [Streptomyces sp. SM12]|uniref:hypothetical protein n=1 Tax=Streptomyces sp. SM12 TaxID=1071602 RepID=UPI0015E1A93E|nr:hypothetical protein [Streptomyces sp. SM12]